LANYDSFYAIKHIEWRYPFVFVHKLIEWSPLIKKYAYSNFYWSGSDGEQANKYHEAELDSYEEDGIFFEEIFMFHLFNALWYPLPSLVKYTAQFHLLPDKTQKHMMETHKKAIQKVQYMRRMALPEEVRGSTSLYFLSKENESWHKMPLYKTMYPDARYLCIVRPPKDSVTSFYPLLYASMGAKTPGVKMQGEVNQMTAIMVQKRIDCGIHIEHFAQDLKESTSQALSENKHAYIHFDVALPNMLKTFAYVLKHLNLPMTPVFKDKIQVLQEKQNKRSVGGHNSIDESIYTGKGYDEFTAFAQQVKIHHKKVLDTVKFA
jgi:hypothetical protein